MIRRSQPVSFAPEIWPPRRGLPKTWIAAAIVCNRMFCKSGRLIWFRNRFGDHDLGFSFNRGGKTLAYRWWPRFRLVELHEDGTLTSMHEGHAEYSDQWIAFRDTDKIYMFMQNSETYNMPFED